MTDDEFDQHMIARLTSRGYTVLRTTLNEQGTEVPAKAPQTPSKGFNEAWALYPRKIGRAAAEKAYSAANGDEVMTGLKNHLAKNGFTSDVKYIPHMSTWINQRRYLDEPEARGFKKPQVGGPTQTRKALDDWLNDE